MALEKGGSDLAGDLNLKRDGNATMSDVLEKMPIRNRIGQTDQYINDARGNKSGNRVDQSGWAK